MAYKLWSSSLTAADWFFHVQELVDRFTLGHLDVGGVHIN